MSGTILLGGRPPASTQPREPAGALLDPLLESVRSQRPLLLQVGPDILHHRIFQSLLHDRPVRRCARGPIRAQGQVLGMRDQQRIPAVTCVCPMTRPGIVGGLGHHPCPDRIELDVPRARQEVSARIHKAGLEPSLPQRPGAPVPPVARNGVRFISDAAPGPCPIPLCTPPAPPCAQPIAWKRDGPPAPT